MGAMAATAGLAIVAEILDQIPQLSWLHPWLSPPVASFGDLLRNPVRLATSRRRAQRRHLHRDVPVAGVGAPDHQGHHVLAGPPHVVVSVLAAEVRTVDA